MWVRLNLLSFVLILEGGQAVYKDECPLDVIAGALDYSLDELLGRPRWPGGGQRATSTATISVGASAPAPGQAKERS